jgi:hypothetical protein
MAQYITDLRQLGFNPTAVPDALLAAKNKLNEIPFNPTPVPSLLYGLATDPQATAAAYNQSNLPVGDFLIGGADRALRGSQNPLDYLDLGLAAVDIGGAGKAGTKSVVKSLTSDFAQDIYRNAGNYVTNKLTPQGLSLQPSIVSNDSVVQPLINEFLENTATKPNERVGKRFTIEDRSNNVPIQTLKAEDLIGKTIVTKPTDLTSRDKLITSVSDLKLPYPLLTEGGELFGAAKKNVDRDAFYASNYSAALGDVNRLKEALELDKARGGTGVFYAPTSMAQHSSNFSTMPTGLLMNFVYDGIRTGRMPKSLIKELDEEIRTGKGLQAKSALPDWKGLMTQEGRDQLRQYGGKYRIGLAAHMMKNQKYQKALGFNNEDVVNALRDEHNRGVGEHMLGNIFYEVDPNVDMRLSSTPLGSGHGSYMFDLIHGRPAGKLPNAIHMETLLGDPYLKDLVEGKITGKNYNKLTKTGKEQPPSTILRQGLNAIHTQQKRPDVYKFITESDAERIDDYLKAIKNGLLEL